MIFLCIISFLSNQINERYFKNLCDSLDHHIYGIMKKINGSSEAQHGCR